MASILSDDLQLTVRYSQKGSSSLGPVGKCAKLEPMEAMNWPKKELPFRMGTPMVVGTVHLCASIDKASGLVCETQISTFAMHSSRLWPCVGSCFQSRLWFPSCELTP